MHDTRALRAFVDDRSWYHTIELGHGIVTPGWFDTRPIAGNVPLPARLDGRRCLDIGTFDGFWAFEMESRGADEVVATDVLDPQEWDWPPTAAPDVRSQIAERHDGGIGFAVAARALGSSVTRLERSIYDLDPDDIDTFDVVYLGSLLLHLRDPILALERVRAVCHGTLVLVDTIDIGLTLRSPRKPMARLDAMGRPWWWTPNRAGLVRMVRAAGFEIVAKPKRLRIPAGDGQPHVRPSPSTLRSRNGRESLLRQHYGDPHVALTARPGA